MSIPCFSERQDSRPCPTEPLFLPNGVVPDLRLAFTGPFRAAAPTPCGGATC